MPFGTVWARHQQQLELRLLNGREKKKICRRAEPSSASEVRCEKKTGLRKSYGNHRARRLERHDFSDGGKWAVSVYSDRLVYKKRMPGEMGEGLRVQLVGSSAWPNLLKYGKFASKLRHTS